MKSPCCCRRKCKCDCDLYSPRTKEVYQWRYRNRWGGWTISNQLYTAAEVTDRWTWDGAEYQKHSGPYTVPT